MTTPVSGLLEWFKPRVRRLAEPLVRGLVAAGVSANALTVAALLLNAVVALLVSQGSFLFAGLLLLLVNSLDFLDGAVARATGTASDFGAFFDSVADRYSELLVFLGLIWWYGDTGDQLALVVSFIASAGSVMVSYARARAEGLGFGGEVGLLQRPERIVLLGVGLIFADWLIFWVLVGLAVLTNLTTWQRIRHVRAQAERRARGS